MRKRIFLAMMVVIAIGMVGCGKKTTTTEVQATPEPTEAPTTTKEPEQDETQAEEVASETDDTGVYYGSKGITELNIGIDTVKCTIKVPLNYIISGAGYLQDDSQQWITN